MLEPAAANPYPEKWGPWQNLPCPDDPTSIAALCPHGWVELTVQQGRSGGDPGNPPEGYQDISPDRVWGLDAEVARHLLDMVKELDDAAISRIPHGMFGMLCRVEYDPGEPGICAPSYGLEVRWGIDSQPVFNLPPPPPLAISFLGVAVDGP